MSNYQGANEPYWTCEVVDAEETQERNSWDDTGLIRNLGGLADGCVLLVPSGWTNVDTCTYTIYGALSEVGAYQVVLATGSITNGVVEPVFFGQALATTPLPFIYILLNLEPAEGETASATITAYIIHTSL